MRTSDKDRKLLSLLEIRAQEQAGIEKSSPLPEWSRPLASFVGTNTFVSLLLLSTLVALYISIFFFKDVYMFYLKGILGWLIH